MSAGLRLALTPIITSEFIPILWLGKPAFPNLVRLPVAVNGLLPSITAWGNELLENSGKKGKLSRHSEARTEQPPQSRTHQLRT
jgi:hypothetical protein